MLACWPHDRHFFVGETAGLEEDVVRRADLADVVHRRGGEKTLAEFAFEAQVFGNEHRIVGHAQDVATGFRVAEFGRTRQARHCFPFPRHDVGGFADNGRLQVVIPVAQPFLTLPEIEHGTHTGVEFVPVNRLGQKVVGPRGEAMVTNFLFVGSGDHQDGDRVAGVELADRFDEFDAVDVRHHVIDDHQVGFVVAAPLQAFQR